jgi:hypothetical protein
LRVELRCSLFSPKKKTARELITGRFGILC